MGSLSKIWEIEEEDEVPKSNLGVLSSSSRIIPLSFSRYSLLYQCEGLSDKIKEKFFLGFAGDDIQRQNWRRFILSLH